MLQPRPQGTHMKTMLLGTVLVGMLFTGSAMANLLEVKEALEGALCRKLATNYANNPKSLTVQSIAQLQICLAQTLKNTSSPVMPGIVDIQPPRPSTKKFDTTLPRPPTPPTPPQSINIR